MKDDIYLILAAAVVLAAIFLPLIAAVCGSLDARREEDDTDTGGA